MKTVMGTSRQTRWMAGMIALLATLFTLGGSLALAGRYAQTGASRHASDYYAAEHTKRIGCPDKGRSRAAAAASRRAPENS